MRTILFLLIALSRFSPWELHAQSAGNALLPMGPLKNLVTGFKDDLGENDGGVAAIYAVPDYQCNETISPTVEIVNYGSNLLTNALIKYYLDAQAPLYFEWEGNLEPGAVDIIEFEPIAVTSGAHHFTVSIVEANGLVDINGGNNDGLVDFYIVGTSMPVPMEEKFSNNTFPEGYFAENHGDANGWKMYTQEMEFGNNNYMMQMHFYFNTDVNPDQVYIKNIDLSNADEAVMNFDVAYKYYKNSGVEYYDKLLVEISTNCGADWEVIYEKEKDELATLPPDGVEFFPTENWEWRTESLNLSDFAGNSNIMIRFDAISGHGNNLYVDDLKITSAVGIEVIGDESNLLKINPNPADQQTEISFSNNHNESGMLKVYNNLGQVIYSSVVRSDAPLKINTSGWQEGFYVIRYEQLNTVLPGKGFLVVH